MQEAYEHSEAGPHYLPQEQGYYNSLSSLNVPPDILNFIIQASSSKAKAAFIIKQVTHPEYKDDAVGIVH